MGVVSKEASGAGPGSRASSRGWCPRHWLLLRSSKRAHSFPHPSWVPPSIFPTAPFCAPPQLGSRDSVAHRNAWLPEFVGHTRQWGKKDNDTIHHCPLCPAEFTEAHCALPKVTHNPTARGFLRISGWWCVDSGKLPPHSLAGLCSPCLWSCHAQSSLPQRLCTC